MNTPPDDSLFSLPIWKKRFEDSSVGRVQMNPQEAFARSQAKPPIVKQVIIGASTLALFIAIVAGGMHLQNQSQSVAIHASFDLKRALVGTIDQVDEIQNSFTLSFISSQDPLLQDTSGTRWTIQLPPGESLRGQSTGGRKTCATVADIHKRIANPTTVPCASIVQAGRDVIVEYLILRRAENYLIAKHIIASHSK